MKNKSKKSKQKLIREGKTKCKLKTNPAENN